MNKRLRSILLIVLLYTGLSYGSEDLFRAGPFFHRWNFIPGIPFREPVFVTFFDLNPRLGFYAYNDLNVASYNPRAIQFDSTEYSLDGISGLARRSIGTLDLNIVRYNWPYLFIEQNIIDFLTGVGVREVRSLAYADINPGWDNKVIYGQKFRFRPRVREVYLSQTLYYQLSRSLLLFGEYSVGWGRGDLYTANDKAYDVSVEGMSKSLGAGIKWILEADRTSGSRITFGLSLDHYSGRYHVTGSELFTPIESIRLAGPGLRFSVHILLGTDQTAGDRGMSEIRKRDYIAASQSFSQYTRNHPRSLRNGLAGRYKAYADSMSYFQHFSEADKLLISGNLRDARQRYDVAVRSNNLKLRQAVLIRRYHIAQFMVREAMKYLEDGDFQASEALINEAIELSPLIRNGLNEVLSEISLQKAVKLIQSGLYGRAEKYFKRAETEFPPNRDRIVSMRGELAKARLEDLSRAVGEADLISARYFMEEARRIDDRVRRLADDYLNKMNAKIMVLEMRQEPDNLAKAFEKLWAETFVGSGSDIQIENIHLSVFENSSEIRDKLGDPHAIKEWYPGSSVKYLLWTYNLKQDFLLLYFHDHILMKIERLPRQE
jgi:tetratricopeptide (TPR) repeat protein